MSGVSGHHGLLMEGEPAVGDPNYSSVKLLLDLDGTNGSTTFTDYAPSPASVTNAATGAAISTTQSKFGGASLFLDGTNDGLDTDRPIGIGTAAFTLEAHIRPTAAQTGRIYSAQQSVSTNAVFLFRVNSTGSIQVFIRDSAGAGALNLSSATGLIAMDDSAWFHVAVTRGAADRIDLWIDGVSVANSTSATSPNFAGNNWQIGTQYFQLEYFKGYLDNVRITEGVCRYTATFTPPIAAYPHSA